MVKLLNRGYRESRDYRDCREGVPLMRHEYIWGMYTGDVENPVQAEMFKAPQAWGAVCGAD